MPQQPHLPATGAFPVIPCARLSKPAGAEQTGEAARAARAASRGSRALREGRLWEEGVPHLPPRQEHPSVVIVHIPRFHTLFHFISQSWEITSISQMGLELL